MSRTYDRNRSCLSRVRVLIGLRIVFRESHDLTFLQEDLQLNRGFTCASSNVYDSDSGLYSDLQSLVSKYAKSDREKQKKMWGNMGFSTSRMSCLWVITRTAAQYRKSRLPVTRLHSDKYLFTRSIEKPFYHGVAIQSIQCSSDLSRSSTIESRFSHSESWIVYLDFLFFFGDAFLMFELEFCSKCSGQNLMIDYHERLDRPWTQ